MKFFKCSQCGYGFFWRSLINSISLYVRNHLIIKWYFVGKRTKNYFLKWTPLFISKYRVKNKKSLVIATVTPLSQLRQCLSISSQSQCNNTAVPLQP